MSGRRGEVVVDGELVFQGKSWPLFRELTHWRSEHAGDGAPVLRLGELCWVVAPVALATPEALTELGLDGLGVLLVPARMAGHAHAWEARRSARTGDPATKVIPRRGDTRNVPVLGVHPDDVALLDAAVGRGTVATLGSVGPVALARRFLLPDCMAYGAVSATQLIAEAGQPWLVPERGQAEADERCDGGIAMRSEPLAQAVDSGWPTTAIENLDLFVYGSLMPGMSRWDAISDIAEVVGPAAARGDLTATFYGWPAAQFGGKGRIHGVLLQAGGAEGFAEMYARCDGIEAEGQLFRREAIDVVVDVDGVRGRQWATSYAWGDSTQAPPGTRIPDGRWESRWGSQVP